MLSTAIVTLNEEKNIARCIDSIKKISDEILVVDSYSTDKTKAICKKKGVRFLQNPFEGHVEQKNYALKMASYNHVLSLDADECLKKEALEVIERIKSNWEYDAYTLRRLTNYCGKWIYHCGWYPDLRIRLFDKRKVKWGGVNPHDEIIFKKKGSLATLDIDILHYSFPSISFHADTANKYSEIASRELMKKGKKIYFLRDVILNPLFTFTKKYLIQVGFLDGYYGFIVCMMSAYSNFLKYSKAWRIQQDKKQSK